MKKGKNKIISDVYTDLTPAEVPNIEKLQKYAGIVHHECWKNDIYTVFVYKDQPAGFRNMDGEECLMTWLSIKRNDRAAKPDWRHFQWIKNQLCGPEREGVEIFPAESRLVDGANQYHIWVVQDDKFRFPFGFHNRIISEKNMFGETQRKFPLDRQPKDLRESEQKLQQYRESIDLKSMTT